MFTTEPLTTVTSLIVSQSECVPSCKYLSKSALMVNVMEAAPQLPPDTVARMVVAVVAVAGRRWMK
jgi:hypothetical protein